MACPTEPSSATDLLTALPAQFENARRSGQLFFFPSEARDIYSDGRRVSHPLFFIPSPKAIEGRPLICSRQFNVRSCPALLDKQKAKLEALAAVDQDESPSAASSKLPSGDHDTGGDTSSKKQEEPFKPPYVPELYLGSLAGFEGEEGMSILLNKYAVLPEHMLLCPPTYQPQSLPPTPHQLALAHSVLLAASRHPAKQRRLLAFYNGGQGAGASQRWRHLQFVEVPGGRAPVEDWVQGMRIDRPDAAVVHPDLPHLHIVHPLPSPHSLPFPPTPESTSRLIDALASALMKMLDLAFDAQRIGGGNKDSGWNLLMTLDHLHLIPRSAPSFPLPLPHEPLELNALGYAGMMLVRSPDEEKALMATVQEGGLMSVLEKCGVPRAWGEKGVEAHAQLHGAGSDQLA